MTKITIKYANGNEDYFITQSDDDDQIFQILRSIAYLYEVASYKVEKEQKVLKK